VLLIGCINAATLLLARGTQRGVTPSGSRLRADGRSSGTAGQQLLALVAAAVTVSVCR
jgi:hypothetical protein